MKKLKFNVSTFYNLKLNGILNFNAGIKLKIN